MGVPATQAEPELAGLEPHLRPRTDAAVRRDLERLGAGVAVVLPDPRFSVGVELQPRLGIVIVVVVEREGGIVERLGRQEAEQTLGARFGRVSIRFVLHGRGRVVDVAGEKHRTFRPVHPPHRVVLVAACAAEVHGVEALVRLAGEELLTIDRHAAFAWGLDRGVRMSRA